jgi:hypothetical protein
MLSDKEKRTVIGESTRSSLRKLSATGIFTQILARPLAQIERERSGKPLNTLNDKTWRRPPVYDHELRHNRRFHNASFSSFLAALAHRRRVHAVYAIPCQLITRRAEALGKQGLAANETLARQTWWALSGLRTMHFAGTRREPWRRSEMQNAAPLLAPVGRAVSAPQ